MVKHLGLLLFCSIFALLGNMPCTAPSDEGAEPEGGSDAAIADAAAADPCQDPAQLREDALTNGTQVLGGVTLEASSSIADIAAEMSSYEGQLVQIEGRITAICSSAGCWASVQDASGYEMNLKVVDGRVDWRDYASVGLYVVGEGVFTANGEHGAQISIDNYGAMVGTLSCD